VTTPLTGVVAVDWALGLLGAYGPPIVLIVAVLENIFIVGSFTPGEIVVMAAAFMAAQGDGRFAALAGVWAAAVTGSVIGSNLSYQLGRAGGRDALLRYGHRFHVSERRIRSAEEYFYRYGSKTVLLARFAAGVKNFVPMIAGVSKMGVYWFELWTVLGAVLYTSVMCAIGFLAGRNFDVALRAVSRMGIAGLVLVAALVGLAVFGRRRVVVRQGAATVALGISDEELLERIEDEVHGERD